MTLTQNNTTTPTVYVVDDDAPLRDSLVGLITAMGFSSQGFASGDAFHHFYQRHFPGCLVLDVRMPGQSGLELYDQLIQEGKRLPVIFITAHADVTTAVAAMKTGAVEFLEKPFDHGTLHQRIQKALTLDGNWRRHESEFNAIDQRISRMNERDQETLQLILAGASNKVMASRLFISERAVEMRRAAIMRKLEVRSLAELLELTITHRLVAEIATMISVSRLHWP
ncbi:MAG TPA: response regulator [Pirellulales bacterium]|nr:response regulator [Pirellulales bacterium]